MSNTPLQVHTNAGSIEVKQTALLPGFGRVWFDERAIANILSQAKVVDNPQYDLEYNKLKDQFEVNIYKLARWLYSKVTLDTMCTRPNVKSSTVNVYCRKSTRSITRKLKLNEQTSQSIAILTGHAHNTGSQVYLES